jgi:hypothetical protein
MDLLPGAQWYSELVPIRVAARQQYFDAILRGARGRHLVFFDPDNGLEISSCRPGRRGSDKYLLWRELADTYQAGHSVLVYQHFPREPRKEFVERIARRMGEITGASEVVAFETGHVVFFLVPQSHDAGYFAERADLVARQWDGLIAPRRVAVA